MSGMKLYVNIPEDVKAKLAELVRVKYRGTSVSQAIRWMIEDAWKELKSGVHK